MGPGPAGAITAAADYSLYVLTVRAADGEQSGCLVGFVTQCSIDPVRFLVCVSDANHTSGVVARSTGFALHLLGEHQVDLASLFGETSGDTVDKFAGLEWRAGPRTGAPVLAACAAWVECAVLERHDVGDHRALLAAPLAGGHGRATGTLTFARLPPLEPGHPADG